MFSCVLRARVPTGHCEKLPRIISPTWTNPCFRGTSPYRSLRKSFTWTIQCFKGTSPYRSLRKTKTLTWNNPVFPYRSLRKKSFTWTIQCFKGTSPYRSLRKTKTLTWTILCFPTGPCEKSLSWTTLCFKGTSPHRSLRNKFAHTIFSCVLRARVPTGHCEKMPHRISLTWRTQCSSVLGARVPTGSCDKETRSPSFVTPLSLKVWRESQVWRQTYAD